MRHPLFVISLSFAAGIAAGSITACPLAWSGAGMSFLTLIVFLQRRKIGSGFYLLLACWAVWLGCFWYGLGMSNQSQLLDLAGHYADLTIEIENEGKVLPGRHVYRVRTIATGPQEGSRRLEEAALLVIKSDEPALAFIAGDQLAVTGKITIPAEARNPGDFNYRQYLRRTGIQIQIQSSPPAIRRLTGIEGWALQKRLFQLRRQVSESFRVILPEQQAALLTALVLGDASRIPGEEQERFKNLGLWHVFSVSGLHIGLILGVTLTITHFLPISRFAKLVLNLVPIAAYTAMVGFPGPTLRAMIMAGLALAAGSFDRKADPLTGLGLAALLLLLANPLQLFDPGFQLSFVTTWGLLYLYPLLVGATDLPFPRGSDYLLLLLAAQLAALPLVAYHFHQIAVLSLISNLFLAAPAAGAVILGALAMPGLWLQLPGTEYLIWAAGALVAVIVRGTELLAQIPFAVLWLPVFSAWLAVIPYAVFVYWGEGSHRPVRPAVWGGGVLLCLLLLGISWSSWPERNLRLTFLDVGQGDSIVITIPGSKAILLDGGGSPGAAAGAGWQIGEQLVLPYLRRQGISRLDLVVCSHAHVDHAQGLLPILREFPVSAFAYPLNQENQPELQQLLTLAAARDIPQLPLRRGDNLAVGGAMLEVLHPDIDSGRKMPELNNNSLVLRLVYGETSILLPGDAEKPAWQDIADSGRSLRSTLLKIPHHGSSQSLDPGVWDLIDPAAGVVSVGAANNFGHPHQAVLDYCSDQGIALFRTDQQGAVMCESDGKRVEIRTFLNQEESR